RDAEALRASSSREMDARQMGAPGTTPTREVATSSGTASNEDEHVMVAMPGLLSDRDAEALRASSSREMDARQMGAPGTTPTREVATSSGTASNEDEHVATSLVGVVLPTLQKSDAHSTEPSAPEQDLRPLDGGLSTGLGGVLYLINILLWLDLPACW